MQRRGSWMMVGPFALVAWGLGCDAQPTSDYQGEKLATLKGTVTSQLGASTTADLALLYSRTFPSNWSDLHWVNRVPVTGDFPSSFTMDLYAPPPGLMQVAEYDRNDNPYYKFSLQTIAAVAATSPEFPVKMDDCIVGDTTPRRLFVLYLERDLTATDVAPYAPGGIPVEGPYPTAVDYFGVSTKGYHLLEAVAFNPADGIPTSFRPLPDDMATPITIAITETAGPDCRPPRQYPYDGGVP